MKKIIMPKCIAANSTFKGGVRHFGHLKASNKSRLLSRGVSKGFVIYSTENCLWCHKTKDFLKEHKVSFTDLDVGKDHDAAHEMVNKSGQMGVPVVDINGKIIVGFNEKALRELLNLK